MAFVSTIDATVPADAVPAEKAEIRANFLAIKNELATLRGSLRGLKAYYGCAGNGSTDDTVKLQEAFNSGLPFFAEPGTYMFTGQLQFTGQSQRCFGAGPYSSVFKPVGVFDAILFTGQFVGMGFSDCGFEGASHTGTLFKVDGAHRLVFNNLYIANPWNVLDLYWCNTCYFDQVYVANARGTVVWYLHGDGTHRSDLIGFRDVICGGNTTARPNGLVVDGFVNTVVADNFGLITMGDAVIIKNTMGATDPLLYFMDALQIDYPSRFGIDIQAGDYFEFNALYVHGSTSECGVRVGANVKRVFIRGKVSGHFKQGIDMAGKDCEISAQNSLNSSAGIGSYPGLLIRSTTQNLRVIGGRHGGQYGSSSNHSYGIETELGAASVTIMASDLSGNRKGPFIDRMTGNGMFSLMGCPGSNSQVIGGYVFGTDSGYNAEATAVIVANALTSITADKVGDGYNFAPTVTIVATNGGSGAAATANIVNGQVTSYTVTAPGAGYIGVPLVVITPTQATNTLQPYNNSFDNLGSSLLALGTGSASLGNTLNRTAFFANDVKCKASVPMGMGTYLKAALPSVTTFIDCLIHVSDATGGATVAYSNGVNWISLRTGAAV